MALWNGMPAGQTNDPLGLGEVGDWSFEETWRGFAANQSALRLHAEEWAWKLADAPDLASQLVEFAGKAS